MTTRWRRLFALVWLAGAASLVGRAQLTETAFTVAPGAWLVEGDLMVHGRDADHEARHRYHSFGYVQVTRGLTAALDLQLGLQAYHRETLRWLADGARESHRAAPRLYLRSKARLRGDAAQTWAVALLPYVSFPLERADDHQGVDPGVILPFSRQLHPDWWLEAQVQAESARAGEPSRQWWWNASANLQRAWSERWGSYLEVVADFGTGRWQSAAWSAGVGMTHQLVSGWSGDIALYRGVSGAAMDWELAVRFVYQP